MASYEYYEKLWADTKPIRGRVEVTKPIGQRRRTWETIEKREGDVYACHLYHTDVVNYYPDGSVGLRAEIWSTPTTAEFMTINSPFYVYKKHSKLWVRTYKEDGGALVYPVPEKGELRLYANVIGSQVVYEPKETIIIKKSVVDRVKAKDARMKIKGFLDWAKTFNKLSDGWVAHETREQFGTYKLEWWRANWDYGLPEGLFYRLPEGLFYQNYNGYHAKNEELYKYLQTCDDVGYMKVYLAMFDGTNHNALKIFKIEQGRDDQGRPSNHHIQLCDYRYLWAYVQRKIYDIADKAVDIRKEVEVPVGSKALTWVV
jgi:hypothetical protein